MGNKDETNSGNAEENRKTQLKRILLTRRAHHGQMTKLQNRANDLLSSLGQAENKREHTQVLEGVILSMESKVSLINQFFFLSTDLIPK